MHVRYISAAAVLFLSVVPQVALAQSGPITPVLSTDMQRVCEAEVTNVMLMSDGVENVGTQPTVQADTRGLKVVRTDNGLDFEQTAVGSNFSTVLRFSTVDNGAVTDANLTGSWADAYVAATPDADLPALAYSLAADVPERLLVGRTFAVGDQYYPEALRGSLMGQMVANLGLPFAVDGALDVRYRGEVRHEGRRAWRFSGEMTARGSGDVNGVPVSLDHVGQAEVLHDAETGLVLRYNLTSTTQYSVRGSPFSRQRATDTYDCEIIPQ